MARVGSGVPEAAIPDRANRTLGVMKRWIEHPLVTEMRIAEEEMCKKYAKKIKC